MVMAFVAIYKQTIKAVLTDPDVFAGLANAAGFRETQGEHQHFGLLKEPLIVVANQLRALNMQAAGALVGHPMG